MNILVIGNGFDIAHDLPTKYTDFLEWIVAEVELWENLKKQKDNITDEIKYSPLRLNIPNDKKREKKNIKRVYHQVDLWNCINDNIWFEYLFQCDFHGEENWIDFESEIAAIIKSIDADMNEKGIYDEIDRLSKKFFNDRFTINTAKDKQAEIFENTKKLIVHTNN